MELKGVEKQEYYIKKSAGTNFIIWKEWMMDVLISKGLLDPLSKQQEGLGHTDAQWKLKLP